MEAAQLPCATGMLPAFNHRCGPPSLHGALLPLPSSFDVLGLSLIHGPPVPLGLHTLVAAMASWVHCNHP